MTPHCIASFFPTGRNPTAQSEFFTRRGSIVHPQDRQKPEQLMPSRVKQIGGAAILAMVLVALLLRSQAASGWAQTDFAARAVDVVGNQLPHDARTGLVGRPLPGPPGADDRFVCVLAPPGPTRPSTVAYEVQFRRGTFGTQVNQIYTPQWQPLNSAAIVRQDCLGVVQP